MVGGPKRGTHTCRWGRDRGGVGVHMGCIPRPSAATAPGESGVDVYLQVCVG